MTTLIGRAQVDDGPQLERPRVFGLGGIVLAVAIVGVAADVDDDRLERVLVVVEGAGLVGPILQESFYSVWRPLGGDIMFCFLSKVQVTTYSA